MDIFWNHTICLSYLIRFIFRVKGQPNTIIMLCSFQVTLHSRMTVYKSLLVECSLVQVLLLPLHYSLLHSRVGSQEPLIIFNHAFFHFSLFPHLNCIYSFSIFCLFVLSFRLLTIQNFGGWEEEGRVGFFYSGEQVILIHFSSLGRITMLFLKIQYNNPTTKLCFFILGIQNTL